MNRNPRDRQYWLRLLAFFVATLMAVSLALPALLGALTMLSLLYAPCGHSGHQPAHFNLPAEEISLPVGDSGHLRGYFIPGDNGAAIIMPPPFNSDRGARLPQAAMLARHGYGSLLLESRPCAGLGPLSLGYSEVDEVGSALAYLRQRPDVDPNSIGLYGFSSAGATAVMAAARYPQVQAVVAEGGYGDFSRNALPADTGVSRVADYFTALYRAAARATYRLALGVSIDRLSPVSVIGEIAPRPVLLIYGTAEASLPGGYQQAAAGPSAALWVVEGAGHGGYAAVAPQEYERRVVEFFEGALGGGEN